MYDELMRSGTKEIVEASPEDKIWGIGYYSTNLSSGMQLGKATNGFEAITKVRETHVKN
jgi:predicted NAD-dependent protein-ADP-ribosyltransferase YbiA (DUF1768 family)